jgi:F0F1-type ATP synthase membrane subunit b/b'
MVPPAAEHIATALKRAERVKPNLKLKNELQRIRNQATRRMDTLSKEVAAFASQTYTPLLRASLSAVLPYVACQRRLLSEMS